MLTYHIDYSFIRKISQKWRWGIVAIYTLAMYIFLPYGPKFWLYVLRQWGDSINYLGWFFILVLGTYFLLHLIFQRNEKDPFLYLAFFLISLTCVAILKYMCSTGPERMHPLMYGVLCCLIFWAFKNEAGKSRVYSYTLLLAFLIGMIDEMIQGLLPMRVFDIKDILMNWLSAVMAVLFIAFVLKPDIHVK